MSGTRFCSECGRDISDRGSGAKTCSDKCRTDRSIRLRAIRTRQRELEDSPIEEGITGRVPAEIDEQIPKVINEELRPVVREALNEDTLSSIKKLINLSPAAITALETQLGSDDEKISQAAAKTILQYTVGHPALVSKEEESGPGKLTINFALPRPEIPDLETATAITVTAEEELDDGTDTRPCDTCQLERTDDQFVAGSDRCVDCFNLDQTKAMALLGNPE